MRNYKVTFKNSTKYMVVSAAGMFSAKLTAEMHNPLLTADTIKRV